jgi:muramoyltetrapeptide carboxypeptidase LdcA involved in peptidoglycan recycling
MTGEFKRTVGSKAEVYHSTASRTSGGLKKKDLMMTSKGRIVSRKKHAAGKKAIKRLFALGYKPTKGRFSLMRKSMSKKSSRRTRKRGGNADLAEAFADPTTPPVKH